jgi:Helix-turn-helix domain
MQIHTGAQTPKSLTPTPLSQKPGTSPIRETIFSRAELPDQGPIRIPAIPTDRMLNTRQVAVILGLSVETLKKWRQRGTGLAYFRFPDGAIRYRLSDVLRFLETCSVTH